ncbi:HD-GYP domain-containing protein [Hydrogenimonas urashimensis]|uniref:HD-GYP domain-containing protein n=1 Tax=Hydrogenimonas urashimensis TaxID=2740515 RepID=UPI00191687B5|nr:HD domain-containing phosphohydrolase [Hydrogenimonas urashimensis]
MNKGYEILIVEDRMENLQLLREILERNGYTVRLASNGELALKSVAKKIPNLILLDIRMEGMDGFEVCHRLKEDPQTRSIPIIFISALEDTRAKVRAFREGGVDYITKPFAAEEVLMRVKTHLQLNDYQHNLEERVKEGIAQIRTLNDELQNTQDEMIVVLGALLEKRDDITGKHVVRVAEFSKRLASMYGLSEEEITLIHKAAPMHDAGKVAIPDHILNKPGSFTPEEWEIMKTHAIKGYEIFKDSTQPILHYAAIIARDHHERWDGKGYPYGQKAEEISIAGRIVCIADVFDALTHDRVYKRAWSIDKARNFMEENRSRMFDPKLLDLFLDNFDEFVDIRARLQD